MNILVSNHPFSDFYTTAHRLHTGTLSLLKDLVSSFHRTIIIDTVASFKKSVVLPRELAELSPYLIADKTGYSFFKGYYLFGTCDIDPLITDQSFKPDVILVSSFAYSYFEDFKLYCNYLKKKWPKAIIICGGGGPSAAPLHYLDESAADYVVAGPAEPVLSELLSCIEKKTDKCPPSVYSTANRRPHTIIAPFNFSPAIAPKKSSIQLTMSRGCQKNCTYCSINLTAGKMFLTLAAKDVYETLSNSITPEITHINFEDDNITLQKDNFLTLITRLKESYPQLSFTAENGMDFSTIDPRYLSLLVKYGFRQFNFSLTTIKSSLRTLVGREFGENKLLPLLHAAKDLHTPVIVYLIAGLPEDTARSVLDTIFFLLKEPCRIGFSPFYPVPGTEIGKKLPDYLPPLLCKGSSFTAWGCISRKEMVTLFMIARYCNQWKKFSLSLWNTFSVNSETGIKDKTFLTMYGLLFSLQNCSIFAVNIKDQSLITIPYPLQQSLVTDFFDELRSITIITESGESITPEKRRQLCRLAFP